MDANPVNIYEYEEIARGKLGQGEYDFIAGAATDEITLRRTRAVFDSICRPVPLKVLCTSALPGLPGGSTVNAQEITAYLAASHIAVVATINRHGHPHLTPNWYRYDGKVLTLITRKDRLKYLNLQRDNYISVCIYDPPVASNYVVISGTATCNDQDIWDEARRIIARYRAPDEVDDYVARWKTEPRVLITVTPKHIATRAPR